MNKESWSNLNRGNEKFWQILERILTTLLISSLKNFSNKISAKLISSEILQVSTLTFVRRVVAVVAVVVVVVVVAVAVL